MKSAALYLLLRGSIVLFFYAASIVGIIFQSPIGPALAFADVVRPINGTIDLFAVRSKFNHDAFKFLIVKLYFSILILFIIILKYSSYYVSIIIGVALFYAWFATSASVWVTRGKINFFKKMLVVLKKFFRIFINIKCLLSKEVLKLMISSLIAAFAFSSLYLTISDKDILIGLRLADAFSFLTSYFIQRQMREVIHPNNTIIGISIFAILVAIFIGGMFSWISGVYVLIKLNSMIQCIKNIKNNKISIVTINNFVTASGYFFASIHGVHESLYILLSTEIFGALILRYNK